MPVSQQRSGLYVVEDAGDFKAVDRELRVIDDRLFLSWEIDHRYGDPRYGTKVYRVLCDYGSANEPGVVCEWRTDVGVPLPLSSGLVEQVKSQRPREGFNAKAAQAANDAKIEKERAELDAAMDEIADDVGPRISDKRSALLHRGPHLRRARRGQ